MRVVLVNWAKIWDGAVRGGGVNGYVQGLALELVSQGHDVVYLASGQEYTHDGRLHVRRHEDWMGVRVFEVFNSPVLAPSFFQYADPDPETTSPELEAAVGRFMSWLRPDVVHWHNLEGFSAGCVEVARHAGARTVYSLHNYHTICPQVYLMQGGRRPCTDWQGGKACATCVPDAPDPSAERAVRLPVLPEPPPPPAPPPPPPHPHPTASALWREFKGVLKGSRRAAVRARPEQLRTPAPETPVVVEPELVGREVVGPDDVLGTCATDGPDLRGLSDAIRTQADAAFVAKPHHPEWAPLGNTPPKMQSPDEAFSYGRRRASVLRALNSCDRVLAVSTFVRDLFVEAGVDADRLRVQPIGSTVHTITRMHAELLFDPPPFDPPRPVRLVFMGHSNWYKGAHMFADALELLAPECLAKLDVSLFAQDGQSIEWRFRRLEPRLAGLSITFGYVPRDLPWMLGGKDLGVVPSVWWDNGPQTVMEYQACGVPVLGAELGGIPDVIRHGENGLLFRGNDRYDLARRLAEVVRAPWITTELRRRCRPPTEMGNHARDLLGSVYASVPQTATPVHDTHA